MLHSNTASSGLRFPQKNQLYGNALRIESGAKCPDHAGLRFSEVVAADLLNQYIFLHFDLQSF